MEYLGSTFLKTIHRPSDFFSCGLPRGCELAPLDASTPELMIKTSPDDDGTKVTLHYGENSSLFDKGWGKFLRDNAVEAGDTIVFRAVGAAELQARVYGRDGVPKREKAIQQNPQMVKAVCQACKKQVDAAVDCAAGDTVCMECGLVLEEEGCERKTLVDDSGSNDGDPSNAPLSTFDRYSAAMNRKEENILAGTGRELGDIRAKNSKEIGNPRRAEFGKVPKEGSSRTNNTWEEAPIKEDNTFYGAPSSSTAQPHSTQDAVELPVAKPPQPFQGTTDSGEIEQPNKGKGPGRPRKHAAPKFAKNVKCTFCGSRDISYQGINNKKESQPRFNCKECKVRFTPGARLTAKRQKKWNEMNGVDKDES